MASAMLKLAAAQMIADKMNPPYNNRGITRKRIIKRKKTPQSSAEFNKLKQKILNLQDQLKTANTIKTAEGTLHQQHQQQQKKHKNIKWSNNSCNDSDIVQRFKSQLVESQVNKQLDETHMQLFNLSWEPDNSPLFHILYYLMNYGLPPIGKKPQCCVLCDPSLAPKIYKDIRYYFYKNRIHLKNILCSLYQCNTRTVDDIILTIKSPFHPFKGMYTWDLHVLVIDKLKSLNKTLTQKVFYHGILYNDVTTPNTYRSFIHELNCISDTYRRHFILICTGDEFNPVHWCGLFVDLDSNICFYFNSLAEEKHLNTGYYNELVKQYPQMRFMTNKTQMQGESSLCGFFVLEWMIAMTMGGDDLLKAYRNFYVTDDIVTERLEDHIVVTEPMIIHQGLPLPYSTAPVINMDMVHESAMHHKNNTWDASRPITQETSSWDAKYRVDSEGNLEPVIRDNSNKYCTSNNTNTNYYMTESINSYNPYTTTNNNNNINNNMPTTTTASYVTYPNTNYDYPSYNYESPYPGINPVPWQPEQQQTSSYNNTTTTYSSEPPYSTTAYTYNSEPSNTTYTYNSEPTNTAYSYNSEPTNTASNTSYSSSYNSEPSNTASNTVYSYNTAYSEPSTNAYNEPTTITATTESNNEMECEGGVCRLKKRPPKNKISTSHLPMSFDTKAPEISNMSEYETIVLPISNSKPVLIDFSTGWCAACRLFWPELNKIIDHFGSSLQVFGVDAGAAADLTNLFNIDLLPTLIILRNGQVVDRINDISSIEGGARNGSKAIIERITKLL